MGEEGRGRRGLKWEDVQEHEKWGETAVGEPSANPCGYGENGHKRVQ